MKSYGDLFFCDTKKTILCRTPFGYTELDNKAFADICVKIIFGKAIDGTYTNKARTLFIMLDEKGFATCFGDARRIEVADF